MGPTRLMPGNKHAETLAGAPKGQSMVIVRLGQKSSHERNRLMALGIMPGATVRLLQRFPAYMVSVGYTQVALDRETAELILVREDV